jgi:hypothetical protein
MIAMQEIQEAWARLMHPDGWQQADDGRVTYRSQIIDRVKYIDFQGSIEIADWEMDFNIWPQSWYHGGYYRAFYNACNDIGFRLDLPAIISGYSCGGAFALIAAIEVCDLIRAPVKIITFAAPRVAWIKKPKIAANTEIINIKVTGDPAVHLPPRWLGYRDNPGQVMRFNAPLSIKAHSPAVYGVFIKEMA